MFDLILANANVITMNAAFPRARTVGILNGLIAYVSAQRRVAPEHVGPSTRVIDCGGRTVIPGFIEPHGHFAAYAKGFATLDVGPEHVASISDLQRLIRDAARTVPPGTWIIGRGYDEFGLAEKRHATRWELDIAAPDHPVKLTHRSGHAHLLNSLALSFVHITMESGDPPGGLVDRTATGEPNGLLYEMGGYLSRFTSGAEAGLADRGVRLAGRSLASLGITMIHDTSVNNDWRRRERFRAWQSRGDVPQRIRMAVGWKAFERWSALGGEEADDGFLAIDGVKIIIQDTTGRMNPGQSELNEMMLAIQRAGCRAIVHAVEEEHIAAACTAIEYAVKTLNQPDHGHRIEHCSVCPPALAKRLAAAGIAVVTHPAFVYYNGDRYVETVPDKELRYLYPAATLVRSGVPVAGSSDFPVVPPNPLIGIYSAVTRRTRQGRVVLPHEGMTPGEALGLYTIQAARALRAESAAGSVEPGKYADLVLLSGDPTRASASSIRDMRVEMTIINGQVVWERTEGDHSTK